MRRTSPEGSGRACFYGDSCSGSQSSAVVRTDPFPSAGSGTPPDHCPVAPSWMIPSKLVRTRTDLEHWAARRVEILGEVAQDLDELPGVIADQRLGLEAGDVGAGRQLLERQGVGDRRQEVVGAG